MRRHLRPGAATFVRPEATAALPTPVACELVTPTDAMAAHDHHHASGLGTRPGIVAPPPPRTAPRAVGRDGRFRSSRQAGRPGSGQLIVLAKQPVAGLVKTRLCPPCSPRQAALLAEAALADTLDAVTAVPAARRLLVLDGRAQDLPPGVDVLAQRGDGLAQRLANAFADAGAPSLLIGMDTPQVTPRLLGAGLQLMAGSAVDAVLGPAVDGGYWAIGLRRPDSRVFEGVPMTTPATLDAQRQRLRSLGLRWAELPVLRDVDFIDDAWAAAADAPDSRFARTLRRLQPGEVSSRHE